MQVSEILRKIADVVDQVETDDETAPVAQEPEFQATATKVSGQIETPSEEEPRDEADLGPMVSPLQQEHELLKKSQGVDNNVDEFAEEECEDDFQSELASMKQAAGIGEEPAGPHNYAEECRPVSLNPRANAALEANNKPHIKHTQRKDY